MSADPPPYPRIPHLPPGVGASSDDKVLPAADAEVFLTEPVVVEEKLDGASVSVWLDGSGAPVVASRGGVGAIDRGNQLGPLRAWMAERADELRALLDGNSVMYGEWLWLVHGIRYDRLPSLFIGLDLRESSNRFLSVDERNARLSAAGFESPPELTRGVLGDLDRLQELQGESAFASEPSEGVVVRRLGDGSPRIAKALAHGFRRLGDDTRVGQGRNAVAR